jgi:eukaryotic-like serine/threonine-protein kinase
MTFLGTSRFRPIRLLGTGGMGSVYLVYDRQFDSKVALKTLNVSGGLDLYRFKREFRSLADLRHVNLVRLYELVSEDELWFFTMEYVVGAPFDRYLRAEASLPPGRERLVRTVQQLCTGVHAVHEAGYIHRDLKPSNVLVTEAGRVVILDFGLAKDTTSQSLSGDGIFGTPAYMAPEQALEKPCHPAADWYAVGTMLYEALTGHCPFEGALLEVLLKKQSEDPPVPNPSGLLADERMQALCMKLIHRDPCHRPTGAEILAHLGVVPGKRTLVQTGRHPAVGTKGVVGREAELQVLQRAHLEMCKGSLAVTMVQGTSGIGKTSLVETFIERRLPGSGTSSVPLVLRGCCHEREALPFKAFDGVVDALTHCLTKLGDDDLSYVLPDGILHLAEIFPVLRRLKLINHERYATPPLRDAKELRNQAFGAFCDLLVRMARLHPVVIFVDDLQWADLDSFALLRALMRQPGAPALQLILNCRPLTDGNLGSAKSLLRDIEAQPGVEVITLGPLSDDNIRTLADDLIESDKVAPALRQHIAETIVGEARGNPFFVVELVQHLLGRIGPEGGLAASPDGRDFQVEGMILKRVGALPEEGQRLLEIIAMAGDPLPQQTLAGAIGVPFGSEAWERGISALVEERLVSRRGRLGEDTVVAYHDRIREAVVRHLDEATLRKLHRQLAEAVEQWDHERTDRLARYWLSADDHERAKRYASDAANEARTKLAFDRAAEFYETAVALESDDNAKIGLLRALGDCRASNGHTSLAAEAYQRAAKLSDSTQSMPFHHLAAEQLLRGGQIAQGLKVLKEVLKQVGLRLSPNPRRAFLSVASRLLWLRLRGTSFVERPASSISAKNRRLLDVLWSVNIGLGVVDILHADDFLLRFLMLALKSGDIYRVSQGLSMLAGQVAAIGRSHFGFSMQLLSKAEVLARRSADAHAIGLTKMCRGVVRYFSGEWEAARTELTAVEQYFLSHCHGVNWEVATTRIFASYSLRMAGRLRELCERFDRYTADADRTGDRYLATSLRTYHSIVWLIRDDCDRASKDIEGLLDAWPGDRYQFQHFTHLFARCEQALYAGRPEVAFQAISAEDARIWRSAMLKINGIRLEYAWLWGRIAVAMAEESAADMRPKFFRLARRSVRFLRKSDHETGVAMGAIIEAGVRWLSAEADRDVGLSMLERAVATAEAAGANLLAESGRKWLGEIVGGGRGEEFLARSNGWMAEQGVQNPARLAHMIVPGFQS